MSCHSRHRHPGSSPTGFTLLEVIVALGILSVSLMIMIESQAGAVFMVLEAEILATGTMLANEKMTETLLTLEQEGWTSMDLEENGDFESFGDEEFRGESLHLDLDENLDGFRWATTVRKIELILPTDLGAVTGDLAGTGYFGEEESDEFDASGMPDLGDMGVSTDMITDYLGNYVREVRVVVWWGDPAMPEQGDGERSVELVYHAINPTGMVSVEDVE